MNPLLPSCSDQASSNFFTERVFLGATAFSIKILSKRVQKKENSSGGTNAPPQVFIPSRESVSCNSNGGNEQIQKLQVLSTISLIVSLIVFVCLVLLIITLWLNKKTKFNIFKLTSQARKKKEKTDITRKDGLLQINSTEISTIRVQEDKLPNLHEQSDKSRLPQMDFSTLTTTFKNYHARSEPDSVSSVYTNKSNRTAQPLAVRLPSEDSTLDFMYDNPALAPSPTLEKDKNANGKVGGNDT